MLHTHVAYEVRAAAEKTLKTCENKLSSEFSQIMGRPICAVPTTGSANNLAEDPNEPYSTSEPYSCRRAVT
jgi:hypothetical protein